MPIKQPIASKLRLPAFARYQSLVPSFRATLLDDMNVIEAHHACVQTQLGRRHSPGLLPPYVLERSGSLYTASRSSSQCETLPENAILDTPPGHVSGGPMGNREVLLQVSLQDNSYA